VEWSECVSAALKCHIVSFKTVVVYYSASFTSSRMKDLCKKWKAMSGTGIVEYLEISDDGCKLKQFNDLT